MKPSKIISITIFLIVTLFPQIITNAQPVNSQVNTTGSKHQADDDTLLLQLYVDKGAYNTGDDILFSGLLSLNGYAIADAQVCTILQSDTGIELWGSCSLTDGEGMFSETLSYGYAIPNDYSGYLLLSVTGSYDGYDAYSEMTLSYGLGDDDEDDEEGELTLYLYPYEKYEYTMGDSPTIGGDVLVDGEPLSNVQVCTDVWGDGGEHIYSSCDFTDSDGLFSFWLEYGVSIPTGYYGNLEVESGVEYNGIFVIENIDVPYGKAPAADLPLEIQLWGPLVPIQIGGWEEIQIGGTVTSQGVDVNDATVTMEIAGQTFQTSTGLVDSGKFYYGWSNDTFPAGEYAVQVTVSKPGYQNATGTISFTVFGDEYDFAVFMDPIHPVYDPATNVPFPGTLTLGGAPVSDWVEIDITYPNGRVEAFSNLSDESGRFTHTQPSLMEPGTYQLIVYYQSDRKQISPVYTFSVGTTITPTITPNPQQPTQAPRNCELIDIVYPPMILVNNIVNVTGKVICTQDEEKIIPQEGWEVSVYGRAPYESPVKAPVVKTNVDGTFATAFTPNVFYVRELGITVFEPETNRKAYWFGPLSVTVEIEADITLSQTDYDQGEILEGDLTLTPNYPAINWDAGLEIYYQISGPVDGTPKQYLFESQFSHSASTDSWDWSDHFYWEIPYDAGAGKYTLTVYFSGHYIAAQTIEKDFYVNDIQHTNLTAKVVPAPDGWSSATLVGQFTDFQGVPIPDAAVRVNFFLGGGKDEVTGKVIPPQEFNLSGSSDDVGNYEINLEPLDLFAGQVQEDPWMERLWSTAVYADKNGYATGAALIWVKTPTASSKMEIISVNPPLNTISQKSEGGNLSYEDLMDMNIQIRVRYNNIVGEGAKLNISAGGNWAVTCVGGYQPGQSQMNLKAQVAINGNEMPTWESYMMTSSAYKNMRAWVFGMGSYHYYFYYPVHHVSVPASKGIGQESTITVSGKLFGYNYSKNSPNPCGGGAYQRSPSVPPDWVGVLPAARVGINLGNSSASVTYNLTPPKAFASGTAWISPTSGELKAKINVGQATGYALQNQQVSLAIVMTDLDVFEVTTDTEKTTSDISIQGSAITDDKGQLQIPLTASKNPCELEEKGWYYVKISSSALDGAEYILIDLRCVEDLKFELGEDFIVVQAADLSDTDPIQLASGKEAGVRAYLQVDGEIYQPENRPVQFAVKFEMFREGDKTPLFPQTKIFSLSEKGTSVAWAGQPSVGSNAVSGEIVEWLDPPGGLNGIEVIPLDFVFKPYQVGSMSTKYEIRITVDPDKTYGESVSAQKGSITVKKMKRLQILFVPVDLDATPMDTIHKQINFLSQVYPLGNGDIGWGIAKNFPTAEMYQKWAFSKATISWIGQIALNIGERYKSTSDANVDYKVVGIVAAETWMEQPRFGSDIATGVYYSNGVALIKDGDGTAMNTLAHELGHSYGLYTSSLAGKIKNLSYSFTGEQYEIYDPPGLPVTGYILRGSRIYLIPDDPSDKTQLQWIKAFGGNLAKEKKKRDNLGTKYANTRTVSDLMGNALGGQQEVWVIPDTYNALFDQLKDPPGEDILIIQGGILDDNTAEFLPIWQAKGHADAVSEDGYYTLELHSSNGDVLYQTKFSLDVGWPGDSAIFSHQVPFIPGSASVVLLEDGQIIGKLDRSGSTPEIQIVEQPVFREDMFVSISWTGTDADADPVTYGLHYQCDNLNFWFALVSDLSETSYTFDAAGLPGGESCKIRVMASDGFNTTQSISESFAVQAKAPIVEILNEDSVFPAGEQVFLHGTALDLEDGIIPSESLRWFSDIDGELGIGSSIAVMLSPGNHNLTLRAQDSTGNFSLAEAAIQVQDENVLTGMGNGLQSLCFLGFLILAIIVGLGATLIFLFALRNRNKQTPVQLEVAQQSSIQDSQGRWWYQDLNTGIWNIWNGQTWQSVSRAAPNISVPQQIPAKKRTSGGACLLSLFISGVIGIIVVGGISLAAYNFFPNYQIEIGQGDLTQILIMVGGGLLVTILGLLLLNNGFKAIITRQATVEDEWGRQREKRGCGAILNGLGQLFFGVVCLVGGLGLMTIAFYQEVLPWLGF